MTPHNRQGELRELVYRARAQGCQQYTTAEQRQQWHRGFLAELLSYSAQDQWEVWQHLEDRVSKTP
jgi:hypothetical protein